ncbi:hypothetical protein BKA93DRAFT_797292 [Sparassis latifolia]
MSFTPPSEASFSEELPSTPRLSWEQLFSELSLEIDNLSLDTHQPVLDHDSPTLQTDKPALQTDNPAFETDNQATPRARSTSNVLVVYDSEELLRQPENGLLVTSGRRGSEESESSTGGGLSESRQGWLLPLPFAPPDPTTIQSLHDVLRVMLPENPQPYQDGALTGMKTMTQTERDVRSKSPLRKVVYVEELVAQLCTEAEKQLCNLKIDIARLDPDVFALCKTHPYVTSSNMPSRIFSEKDTEDWCNDTLFRPALFALRCVMAKRLLADFDEPFPYLSSAPGGKTIPDGIIVKQDASCSQKLQFSNTKDSKVVLTIEVKTQPAWENMKINELFKRPPPGTEEGTAMRFVWPTEDDKIIDEQTRLFVQVWTHMVNSPGGLEIISTYQLTTFLVRGRDTEKNDDTLYISPTYDRTSCPIYAVYCWLALAMDVIKFDSLKLPVPVTARWPKSAHNEYHETCGILPETLYDRCGPAVTPSVVRGVTTRSKGPAVFGAL